MLGNLLLYRFERHQYADIRRQFPDKELVELYGAEHLLRLFVQIPSLIAHTNMDCEAIHTLVSYLTDILG
jgi:mortality factor 4-like protein 1